MAFDITPRRDDTDNVLLKKILLQVGGIPLPGDFDNTLYRKILEQLGGIFHPGDNTNILIKKILTQIGGTPRPGDTNNRLLWKIVDVLGNSPKPGDFDNILLQKIALPSGTSGQDLSGFVVTPSVNPGGDPIFTITVGPSQVGKWFAFRIALTDPSVSSGPSSSDFILVLTVHASFVGQIITFAMTLHPDWPVPYSPVQVCLETNVGNTEAAAILARGGSVQCFLYPDQFATVPDAPVATAATNIFTTSFDANWNAATGATGYRLDVSTDIAFGSFVAGFNNLDVGNVTTYSVSGLSLNTTYYYRLRAVNAQGASANSNTISLTTLAYDPDYPSSISGLTFWWKADSFSLADGTAIGGTGNEWHSGATANDLTQATSTKRPLFKTNIFGSKPSIRFDGTDDVLNMASTFVPAPSGSGFTFVCVHKDSASAGGMLMGNTGVGYQVWIRNTNVISYFDAATQFVSDGFSSALTAARASVWRRNPIGNTISFRENKTARGSSGGGNDPALNIVGNHQFGLFLKGDLGELLIFTGPVSNTDLDNLYDNYLKPKFGLP